MYLIVPIPKNARKSLNDSSNYRGIALSSALGKLLDWILIDKNPHILQSCDLQFAYKKHCSTSQCTFVVEETVNYYINNNSDIHIVMLDASKAFDRVHYVKLFNELRQRALCPILCRYLALQYTLQKCRLKWGTCHSELFSVKNGVKQGGVLSPILFTIYLDQLLMKLKNSGYGCHIGNTFCGAMGYADDIVLLAPSRHSMQSLLGICEQFSEEFQIKFNASKSKHIFMSKQKQYLASNFKMFGTDIPTVNNEVHLGNIIGQDSFTKTIDSKVSELYQNVNLLVSQFPCVNIDTRYRLFKSYCMSIYGSQLWDFENAECTRFYTAWRKSVRRLLQLPARTHNNLLPSLCNDIPVERQLFIRFLNFAKSCSNSKMECVKTCTKLATSGSSSKFSNSLKYIYYHMNIPTSVSHVNTHDLKDMVTNQQSADIQQRAGLIRDLLEIQIINRDPDLKILIDDLCIN